MTATQQARVKGFDEQLRVRGVELKLGAYKFDALINQTGYEPFEGEVSETDLRFAEVHILNTHIDLDKIEYQSVLKDEESKIEYTVRKLERFDLKTVFRCTVERAGA